MRLYLIPILLYVFSNFSLSAQTKKGTCKLVESKLDIQEYAIKDTILSKVLDGMLNIIEEEEVNGKKIPYRKTLHLEKSALGVKVELFSYNGYPFDDSDLKDFQFISYKSGIQILLDCEDKHILQDYFEPRKEMGQYTTYKFFSDGNAYCIPTFHINQKIVYEIRGNKYRFQEKTLTHTQLDW